MHAKGTTKCACNVWHCRMHACAVSGIRTGWLPAQCLRPPGGSARAPLAPPLPRQS
jgi:hypothetical protein